MLWSICQGNLHKIKGTFNIAVLSVTMYLVPPKSMLELGGFLLY